MTNCSLCGLPTPDTPVTDKEGGGSFCCRGCLHVARTLDEVDPDGSDAEIADLVGGGGRSIPPRMAEALEANGSLEVDNSRDAVRVEESDTDDALANAETEYLSVEGMHCATCELFLESRATANEAVHDAAASYPAGLLKLTYDSEVITSEQLPGIVDGLGYRISTTDTSTDGDADSRDAGNRERPDESDADDTRRTGGAPVDEGEPSASDDATGRLLVGAFFGMMAMCWYALFLYPSYLGFETQLFDVTGLAGQYLLWNVWLTATVALGYTGAPLLRGAYVSLRTGLPNMDLLVALAAVTAYVYSTLVLALGGSEVYFDVTIVIVLAVTVGNAYEDRIRRRAAATLTDLTEERASVARRRTEEGFERIAVEELASGDEIVIRNDERIPADGTIVEGSAAVDESLITGESLPIRREPGDDAIGGALVAEGGLVVEVDRGTGSTADRLVELLWNVQTARSGTQRLVDRVAALFVPVVVVLAVCAALWHLLAGAGFARTLLIGLSVLVVSCPCALGLATPLAISSGVRTALRDGVVITDNSAFERADEIETVAFDKTGTLTTGSMCLLEYEGDSDVLQRAAALEQFADHPIGTAITEAAPPTDAVVSDVSQHPGAGIGGVVDGEEVLVGRRSLFAERDWSIPETYDDLYAEARESGVSPALVGWDSHVRGVLVAGDEPRPEWETVVTDLAADRRVVVISGDDRLAAERFRAHPAIEEVFAGVPPAAKAEIVDRLQTDGPVAMVGDGSNDAPALAAADLGVSLERGTQLAAEAADAVVTTDDLHAVARTFDVLDATRSRIRQNLVWALCYNAVAIPLAVTGLLNPLFAAVAMAASSLLVVGNSARDLVPDDGVDANETDEQLAAQSSRTAPSNRVTQSGSNPDNRTSDTVGPGSTIDS